MLLMNLLKQQVGIIGSIKKYKMKYQKLKDLLIEIQKDKTGNLLKESLEKSNKINLSEIVDDILSENDPKYSKQREKQIQSKLQIGHIGGGAWSKQKYESFGDYQERVEKADYRLGDLIGNIKSEVSDAWKQLERIPAINELDVEAKKQILEIIVSKLNYMAGEMLHTLSVYPFEWDLNVNNL